MAERRMFSKRILESDDFNKLTIVTRMLYIGLNLGADDEGFVGNTKKIMRNFGAKMNHFSSLKDAGYVIEFESGVTVITHWNLHNKLAPGRKSPTQYMKERASLTLDGTGAYVLKSPSDTDEGSGSCNTISSTEDRKEKERPEKNSVEKVKEVKVSQSEVNDEYEQSLALLQRTINNKKISMTKSNL